MIENILELLGIWVERKDIISSYLLSSAFLSLFSGICKAVSILISIKPLEYFGYFNVFNPGNGLCLVLSSFTMVQICLVIEIEAWAKPNTKEPMV